jgi:hypothetical protein
MRSGSAWRRCSLPRSRRPASRTSPIGRSSTASCGSCGPAPPGGTCRRGTAPGRRWTAASAAGAGPGSGTGSSPPSRRGRTPPGAWTGRSTAWPGRCSGRTSTRPGRGGGPGGGGAGPQPGRLLDEGAPPRGGRRQADDAGADARPAARGHRLRAPPGARGRPAPRAGPPAGPAAPGGRRHGVDRPPAPRVLPAAGHPLHHPAAAHRAPRRAVRPSRLSAAPPSREPHQPLQAVPQPGHPLRQAGRELPRALGHRVHYPVASRVAFAYRP